MHCCINILSCYEKLIHYLFKKQFSEMKRKEKIQNLANFRSTHQRCSVLSKKVFLEISQNSRENTCARASFLIKLAASGSRQEPGSCFWKQTGAGFWVFLIFLNLKSVRTCFIVVASRMILLLENVIKACLHLSKDMLKWNLCSSHISGHGFYNWFIITITVIIISIYIRDIYNQSGY